MERKCAVCGLVANIDKANSNKIISYKKKFYHYECFSNLCDQKMTSKRTSPSWAEAKAAINDLVEETTKAQQTLIDKDILCRWVMEKYELSLMSNAIYTKFDAIYCGTYSGLAYAITPLELFNEWQYYWEELCGIHKQNRLSGEPAIHYDLAVLLRKNAEYRRIVEKNKIAQELRKQQMEEEALNAIPRIIVRQKTKSKNKIADLYQEMNGGEDNE